MDASPRITSIPRIITVPFILTSYRVPADRIGELEREGDFTGLRQVPPCVRPPFVAGLSEPLVANWPYSTCKTFLQWDWWIQVDLFAILIAVGVVRRTLKGPSHLGEYHCFFLLLFVKTQSPTCTFSSSRIGPSRTEQKSLVRLCLNSLDMYSASVCSDSSVGVSFGCKGILYGLPCIISNGLKPFLWVWYAYWSQLLVGSTSNFYLFLP